MMKTCTKCNETKALAEFNCSQKGKFGKRADCRACQNNYALLRKVKESTSEASQKLWRGMFTEAEFQLGYVWPAEALIGLTQEEVGVLLS